MKKLLNLLFVFSLLMASGCTSTSSTNKEALTFDITKGKSSSAVLDTTLDEFTKEGFDLGDSLNLEFSDGTKIEDVPYINGNYVRLGRVIVSYSESKDTISLSSCYGSFFSAINYEEGMTCEITLNEKAKYLDLYNTFKDGYSSDRNDYNSDIEFANFRNIVVGNMKENFIYRGASPIDETRNRGSYANALIESVGIHTDIDLADSSTQFEAWFEKDSFDSAYVKELYEQGNVATLSMNTDSNSDEFKLGVKNGFEFMLNHEGPYYIHCIEGKDRTGIVCILLESLSSATYEEMKEDYITTYINYYHVEKDSDIYKFMVSELFETILQKLYSIDSATDLTSYDYKTAANEYLLGCGLTEEEITNLTTLITK